MRFLRETKFYKKIIKSTSYVNPMAGIFMIWQEKKHETRLGLQCQTPALSKVYFTRVGTIISGLKKFLVPKKSWSKKIFGPKKI